MRNMSPSADEKSPAERRQKIRFDVEGLQGGVRLPMDARIVDLGFGGLGVETNRWLQVGRRYTISLPAEGSTLRVSGTIAWCVLDRTVKTAASEAAPVYKAGVQFHDPDPATLEAIEKLLARAAQVGLADRIRGRFRYRREATVDVELGAPFTVRRLSLTGMLVDAGFVPEVEDRFRVSLHVDGEVLDLDARVAYVEPSRSAEGEEAARVGLELLDLRADQLEVLRGIVRSEIAHSTALLVGDPETATYHRTDCRSAADCSVGYRSRSQAERAGLRPGACCLS